VGNVLGIRLVVAALLCAGSPPGAPPRGAGCRPDESAVVVDTSAHRLRLCWRGEPERTFVVSLGVSGVDKRREGDNRTPLGDYPLGRARTSRLFHTFIPVAYPTPAQARTGYTGGAIGIHGPPRGLGGVTRLLALVASDWTAGCIAVATDDEIDEIATWMRQRAVRGVRLTR
jgi:hypothetical protein